MSTVNKYRCVYDYLRTVPGIGTWQVESLYHCAFKHHIVVDVTETVFLSCHGCDRLFHFGKAYDSKVVIVCLSEKGA